MNQNYVSRVLSYHGEPLQQIWQDIRGIKELYQMNITPRTFFPVYAERQNFLTFEERQKYIQFHQFLAQKAEYLYNGKYVRSFLKKKLLKFIRKHITLLPSYDFFLNDIKFNNEKSKIWQYRLTKLKPGDIIYASVEFLEGTNLFSLKPLCTGKPQVQIIADIPIKTVLLQAQPGKLPSVTHGNYVRCELVNAELDHIALSMTNVNTKCNVKLGLVDYKQLPELYRRFGCMEKQQLCYEQALEKLTKFQNPNYKALYLVNGLNIKDHFSLMSNLKIDYPREDYAKEMRTKQASVYILKSKHCFKNGNAGVALQALNIALCMDPFNIDALVARGAIYANSGLFLKAIKHFKKVLKLNKYNMIARNYLCDTLVALGKSYEAKQCLGKAFQSYSKCILLIHDHEQANILLDLLIHRVNEAYEIQRTLAARKNSSSSQSIDDDDDNDEFKSESTTPTKYTSYYNYVPESRDLTPVTPSPSPTPPSSPPAKIYQQRAYHINKRRVISPHNKRHSRSASTYRFRRQYVVRDSVSNDRQLSRSRSTSYGRRSNFNTQFRRRRYNRRLTPLYLPGRRPFERFRYNTFNRPYFRNNRRQTPERFQRRFTRNWNNQLVSPLSMQSKRTPSPYVSHDTASPNSYIHRSRSKTIDDCRTKREAQRMRTPLLRRSKSIEQNQRINRKILRRSRSPRRERFSVNRRRYTSSSNSPFPLAKSQSVNRRLRRSPSPFVPHGQSPMPINRFHRSHSKSIDSRRRRRRLHRSRSPHRRFYVNNRRSNTLSPLVTHFSPTPSNRFHRSRSKSIDVRSPLDYSRSPRPRRIYISGHRSNTPSHVVVPHATPTPSSSIHRSRSKTIDDCRPKREAQRARSPPFRRRFVIDYRQNTRPYPFVPRGTASPSNRFYSSRSKSIDYRRLNSRIQRFQRSNTPPRFAPRSNRFRRSRSKSFDRRRCLQRARSPLLSLSKRLHRSRSNSMEENRINRKIINKRSPHGDINRSRHRKSKKDDKKHKKKKHSKSAKAKKPKIKEKKHKKKHKGRRSVKENA